MGVWLVTNMKKNKKIRKEIFTKYWFFQRDRRWIRICQEKELYWLITKCSGAIGSLGYFKNWWYWKN